MRGMCEHEMRVKNINIFYNIYYIDSIIDVPDCLLLESLQL